MKKKQALALLLLPALLLGGCQTPAAPENPDPPGETQSDVQPLALPSSDGIDWGSAPCDTPGSGDPMPQSPSFPYYTYHVSGYVQDSYGGYGTEADENGVILTVNSCALTGLKDEKLQEEINALISERVEALSSSPVDVDLLSTAKAQGFDAHIGPAGGAQATENYGEVSACARRFVSAYAAVTGRLLSIQLAREDSLELYDGGGELIFLDNWVDLGRRQEVLLYDLGSGQPLALSDLFFSGSDYHALLDGKIAAMLSGEELKRPFRGLPEDYPYIWVDQGLQVSFPPSNPYTTGSRYFFIPLEDLYTVSGMFFEDPSPYLADSAAVSFTSVDLPVELSSVPLSAALLPEGESIVAPRLRGGDPSVADAVNAALDKYETRFSTLDYLPEALAGSLPDWEQTSLSVNVRTVACVLIVSYDSYFSGDGNWAYRSDSLLFDLRTGQRLTAADLLLPSGELTELLRQSGIDRPLEEIDNLYLNSDFSLYIPPDTAVYQSYQAIDVPAEYFNFAFLDKEVTP